ncbi:hypothetical protein ACJZ2D_001065 [Fusarium nematophilum]
MHEISLGDRGLTHNSRSYDPNLATDFVVLVFGTRFLDGGRSALPEIHPGLFNPPPSISSLDIQSHFYPSTLVHAQDDDADDSVLALLRLVYDVYEFITHGKSSFVPDFDTLPKTRQGPRQRGPRMSPIWSNPRPKASPRFEPNMSSTAIWTMARLCRAGPERPGGARGSQRPVAFPLESSKEDLPQLALAALVSAEPRITCRLVRPPSVTLPTFRSPNFSFELSLYCRFPSSMDINAPFSAVPANGGAPTSQMSFSNGTPPATDMGSVAPPPGSGQEPPKTTLWMGELEPWMDENFIKGVFLSSAGETVNVKVIRDKNSGNAGYCFVEFQSPEAATKALGLNGTPVPNSSRQFKLNWASGGGLVDRRDDRGPEYSIFVGDLGPEVNEYVLVSLFQARFPSCKSAKIMTDAMSGQSRGYGFVRFSDENDQQRALVEMQGVYCGNRPMRISTATPKNRGNHGFGHGHHNGSPMMGGGMPQQQMWNGGMQGFPYGGFNPATQMNQFTDPNNTTVFMQGYPIGNSRVRLSWGRSQNNSGVGTPYRPAPPPPHYMGMPSHGGPGNYGPQHFGGPAPGPQGPPGPPGPPGPAGPPQMQ